MCNASKFPFSQLVYISFTATGMRAHAAVIEAARGIAHAP
jgi:hypothetical protein